MFGYHLLSPVTPDRVVIVGAAGFVGKAVASRLTAQGVQVLGITRFQIDLLESNAANKLAGLLRRTDTLVMISAQAPAKNNIMLTDNLRMMTTVCDACEKAHVEHVIYVSSDAVYADADEPLNEASCVGPTSLHGIMHLAREVMLANTCSAPLCILRPTLIYGANDPHNGYGPNRFRRLAQRGEDIVLFGNGEEQRDHVYVGDVAELIARCALHKSVGILNVATGTVTSFREIAERVAALVKKAPAIRVLPRLEPMPHRGYRAFDTAATKWAFPDFCYTTIEIGLALSQQQEFGHGRN